MRANNRRKGCIKCTTFSTTSTRKRALRRNSVRKSTSSSSSDSSVEIDDSDGDDFAQLMLASKRRPRKRKLFSEEMYCYPASPIEVCTKPKDSVLPKCNVNLVKLTDREIRENGSSLTESVFYCVEGPRLQGIDGTGDSCEVLGDRLPPENVSDSDVNTFSNRCANEAKGECWAQTDLCTEESVNHVSGVGEFSRTGMPVITSVHFQSGDGNVRQNSDSTCVASAGHQQTRFCKQLETNVDLRSGERHPGEYNVVVVAAPSEQVVRGECETRSDWTMVSCTSEQSLPEVQDSIHSAVQDHAEETEPVNSCADERDCSENLSLLNRLLENDSLPIPESCNGTLPEDRRLMNCYRTVASVAPLKEGNGDNSMNSSAASLTDLEPVPNNSSLLTNDSGGDEQEPSLENSSFEVIMVSGDQEMQKSSVVLKGEDSLDKFSDSYIYEEGCCLQ